ncbi:MAG: electron transfer flavoprotein subunit alpha/FixB family protein, partial [Candidatus Methanodesulfokora sp.]
ELSVSRKTKVLERREKKISGAALDKARIVIGCGMGFKSKEDLKLAYDLAELMGAAVGSSRPLAADLKWMPEERWIGMSGVSIKPDLYIAVGISGQQQHVAGITDSKVIVAVNTDPNAPIFKSADYCINQDLYEFLPALAAAIRRRRGG